MELKIEKRKLSRIVKKWPFYRAIFIVNHAFVFV